MLGPDKNLKFLANWGWLNQSLKIIIIKCNHCAHKFTELLKGEHTMIDIVNS